MPEHLDAFPCEVTDEERTTALKELEKYIKATADLLVEHHSALGTDIKFVTFVERLTLPVILEYTRTDGVPNPGKTYRHQGLDSYTVWTSWGDVRMLANGMLVLIETHIVEDAPTDFCLAIQPEKLNEHQLRELGDRLSGLADNCRYEMSNGRQNRQRLRDRNDRA